MKYMYIIDAVETVQQCINTGEGAVIEFYHNSFTMEIHSRFIPESKLNKPSGRPYAKDYDDKAQWCAAKKNLRRKLSGMDY